jgi:hypothetical protein
MSPERTPETVTREIEREREQLALAVSHLRSELKAATDVRAFVRAKLPWIAAAAGLAGAALTAKRFVKQRRRPKVWGRLGRFTLVER